MAILGLDKSIKRVYWDEPITVRFGAKEKAIVDKMIARQKKRKSISRPR
jgi:hypothetical protein